MALNSKKIKKDTDKIVEGEYTLSKWEGSWEDFLGKFEKDPYKLARTSEQHLYDSILYYGKGLVIDSGEPIVTYNVFLDPFDNHESAIFGLERTQRSIVTDLKAFAFEEGYSRNYLLVGPPGSCKTPHFDLLVKGAEEYSRTPDGQRFSYGFRFPKKSIQLSQLIAKDVKKEVPIVREDSFEHHILMKRVKGDNNKLLYVKGKKSLDQLLKANEKVEGIVLEGSLAYLPSIMVDLELMCDMRDNPLLLIPKRPLDPIRGFTDYRKDVLEEAFAKVNEETRRTGKDTKPIPRKLLEQEVCKNCNNITEFLMRQYDGDYSKVLDHVIVKNYVLSEAKGEGISSVEPTESLGVQLIPLNRLDPNVSKHLPGVDLVKMQGKLVGSKIVHYHDGLKGKNFRDLAPTLRLVQNNKMGVGNDFTVDTDTVHLYTSNDSDLTTMKRADESDAWFDRTEICNVNFILNVQKEKLIYVQALKNTKKRIHVAPHTIAVASMWSVLSRLEKPVFYGFDYLKDSPNDKDKEHYGKIKKLYESLTPIQKMKIYYARTDKEFDEINRLSEENEIKKTYEELSDYEKKILLKPNVDRASAMMGVQLSAMTKERRISNMRHFDDESKRLITPTFMKHLRNENPKEGKEGISPRKLQDIFRKISKDVENNCLTPFHVFSFLENIVEKDDRTNYPFLSDMRVGDDPNNYKAFKAFISLVKSEYEQVVQYEIIDAISDVDHKSIDSVVRKYFHNVEAWVNDRKMFDEFSGKDIDPDDKLMKGVEGKLGIDIAKADNIRFHREDLIIKIGALEREGKLTHMPVLGYRKPQIDYKEHFPEYYIVHKDGERKLNISLSSLKEALLKKNTDDYQYIPENHRGLVDKAFGRLKRDHGYCDHCAQGTLLYSIDKGMLDFLEKKNKKK